MQENGAVELIIRFYAVFAIFFNDGVHSHLTSRLMLKKNKNILNDLSHDFRRMSERRNWPLITGQFLVKTFTKLRINDGIKTSA